MTIDGLNALTTLTAGDELPVWDVEASAEEPTKKITASNLAASVKSLASLPNTTEMNTAIQQSTAIERVTLNASSMTFESPLSLYKANTVEKTGNICVLRFSIKINSATAGRSYSITNYLPAGMRPYVGQAVTCTGDTGLGDGKAQSITVDANGVLTVWPVNLNKTTYCVGTAAFVCS